MERLNIRLGWQIWLKAYHDGMRLKQPLILKFADKAACERTRMMLYNSVRGIRQGKPGDYPPELKEAVFNVQLTTKQLPGEWLIQLQHYEASPELREIARQAGLSLEGINEAANPTPGAELLSLLSTPEPGSEGE